MNNSKIVSPTARDIPIAKYHNRVGARYWHLKLGASLVLGAWCLVLSGSSAHAQYSLDWFKIAGGGGESTNASYRLLGAVGQHDAGGPLTNTMFSLVGGFWPPADQSPECAPVAPGIIGWWRGDGNALDSMGTNHGSLINGATFAPGLIGQAFSFNASANSAVVVPLQPALNPVDAITIEAWIKPFSFPNPGPSVVRKHWNDLGGAQYAMLLGDGASSGFLSMGVALHQGGAAVSGGTIPTSVWTHVAGTYDRQFVRIYINGVEVGSAASTAPIPNSTRDLYIGNEDLLSGTRAFDGLIDELVIYDRALSPSEIRAIHRAASLGRCDTRPTLNIAALPGAVRLTWTTNATGYLLETNSTLTLPAGWGVLASTYSVLNTNFAVTNVIDGATRFYRLHKP